MVKKETRRFFTVKKHQNTLRFPILNLLNVRIISELAAFCQEKSNSSDRTQIKDRESCSGDQKILLVCLKRNEYPPLL